MYPFLSSEVNMAKLNKKYIENFEKLARDFEKLKMQPNSQVLNTVMQDVQQLQNDLRNVQF